MPLRPSLVAVLRESLPLTCCSLLPVLWETPYPLQNPTGLNEEVLWAHHSSSRLVAGVLFWLSRRLGVWPVPTNLLRWVQSCVGTVPPPISTPGLGFKVLFQSSDTSRRPCRTTELRGLRPTVSLSRPARTRQD